MFQIEKNNYKLIDNVKQALLSSVFVGFLSLSSPVYAESVSNSPVKFSSNSLEHDEKANRITAIGDVELEQAGQIIKADKIVYNINIDNVIASGNVTLLDTNGDVHFSEYISLKNEMKDGFAKEVRSRLSDGSNFWAKEIEHKDGIKTTMKDATYTPCKICEENPDKTPLWRLKAAEATLDETTNEVRYKDAKLELFGVPIAYTPIFVHSGPNVKRKSGFLKPKAGWSSELGTFVESSYYWDIAENKDATFNIEPTTRQGVLTKAQYRHRFKNGKVNLNTSVALNSNRTEEDGRIEENKTRANIFADGLFDLDDKWRAGFDVQKATDKSYLRLYDISNENVLESEIYAERFSGRNYSRVSALNFQDIREGVNVEQPDLVPNIEHRMIGEPNSALGGRWSVDTGLVNLVRSDDDQDVTRASLDLGWQREFIAPKIGLKTSINANLLNDYYLVRDSDAAKTNSALSSNTEELRTIPRLHIKSSLPMVNSGNRVQTIIEPIMSATIAERLDDNDHDIPNEDSIDTSLEVTNLFDSNRFTGSDRQEDGKHVAYGLKAGFYDYKGSYITGLVGQSHQFKESNLFPDGSGLENKQSDIVAEIDSSILGHLDLNYRVQLEHDNFKAKKHELNAKAAMGRFTAHTRYLLADAVEGTNITESREQLLLGGGYRINDDWRVRAAALRDFGDDDPGLRSASAELSYIDECFTFSLSGIRDLSNDSTGSSETKFLARIGLKNIGEISSPEWLVRGNDTDE